jgi:predicted Rossmann fold flavoprotein
MGKFSSDMAGILRCSAREFEANHRGRRRRGGIFRGHRGGGKWGADVTVLEKTARFLDKVRISGGGRCNVTHACFEPREFATRYPRGEKALLSPFSKFSARDTVDWFAARGVKLKTESDGRMFPVTDSSETIVNCLLNAAQKAGVKLRLNCAVESVAKNADGKFELTLAGGEKISCDKLLLATGGCRAAAAGQLAVSLGHTLESPVPSLFTFKSNRRGCARSRAFRWTRKFPFPPQNCASAGRCW